MSQNLLKTMSRKFVLGFAALALAFSVSTVSAATVSDLQAMIAQLQAQLAAMSSSGGATASVGYTFTRDLTIGSRGADVTALQQALVSNGFLTMPAGASMGYFGNLTKMAVAKWQASAMVSPAAGYFGAKSRAAFAASTAGSTASTGGTTTGGTTPTPTPTPATGITTIGKEGIATVDLNPTPSSGQSIYVGNLKAPFLGIRVKAQNSDLDVQRVQVDLGTNSAGANLYSQVFQTIYLLDPSGNVVASSPLNSNTVTRSTSGATNTYYITLTGFHYVVPINTTKYLVVAFDTYPSVDSTYRTSYTIGVDANGVRAVDGAGINQTGPSGSGTNVISQSQTVAQSLAQSATLQVSTDPSTPLASEYVATSGSSLNQSPAGSPVTLLAFDVLPQNDNVQIDTLTAGVAKSGTGGANAATAYLYDASNPSTAISSATVSAGTAAFTNINYKLSANTTKQFLIKVDFSSANSTASTWTASVTATNITSENSLGAVLSSANTTGTATGNSVTARNVGPVFTLVGTPSIVKGATAGGSNGTATSTATATFTLQIQALGGNIDFGNGSSGTPIVANGNATQDWVAYNNGSVTTNTAGVGSSTSITVPSSGVVTTGIGTNTFEVQQNNTVTLPISMEFDGRTSAGSLVSTGSYAIQLNAIHWLSQSSGGLTSSTFMNGQTNWRTPTVALP
jgi:hypothetical protein